LSHKKSKAQTFIKETRKFKEEEKKGVEDGSEASYTDGGRHKERKY
jgi:hypothetical protein